MSTSAALIAMGQNRDRDGAKLEEITKAVDVTLDVSSQMARKIAPATELPPEPKETPAAREARLKREVHHHIEEMTIFIFFLVFFTYASLAGRVESDVFFFQSKVSGALRQSEFLHADKPGAPVTFETMQTVDDVYSFLEGPLYETLWTAESFDGDESFPPPASYTVQGGSAPAVNMRGTVLGQSLLLGGVRLSQLRVRGETCLAPAAFTMPASANVCYPPFSQSASDSAPFGLLAAEQFSVAADAAAVGRDEPGFSSAVTSGSFPAARFAQMLPNIESSAGGEVRAALRRLRDRKYIDPATRLLLIDYNLYNANLDVLLLGRLAVELPQSGGVLVSEGSVAIRLWLYHRAADWGRAAAEAIVVLMVLHFTRLEFKRVRAALRLRRLQAPYAAAHGVKRTSWRRAVLGGTGSKIMMLNLLLFYAVFVSRAIGMLKLPATVAVRGDAFVDVRGAARWLSMSNNINSFNAFLTWMMVFKFLYFIPQFRMLIMVLQKASGRVQGFLCITAITLFACSQAFMLIFGGRIFAFRNLTQSLFSLLRMLLGDFDFEALRLAQPVLGPIMFTVFILVVVFVLLNVFIAIVSTAFAETQVHFIAARLRAAAVYFCACSFVLLAY